MTFSVRKVHPDAIIPTRKNWADAGVDLYSIEDIRIDPWSQAIVDTGLELVSLPLLNTRLMWMSVLQIWPKSGLDARVALHTGAGVIDYLYRGNILVLVKNQSYSPIIIHKGDTIAQAVVVPCYVGDVLEVTETNETERGATGGIASALKGASGTTENFKDIGFAPKEKYGDWGYPYDTTDEG